MSVIGRMLNFMANKSPPTFVAVASADYASSAITINKPTGTQDGDLMIAMIAQNATQTVTTLAGWTSRGSFTTTGGPSLYVFTKIAAGEGASYAWTVSGVNGHGDILSYRGSSIAFDVIGAFAHATSSSLNVSVTTNFPGAILAVGAQLITTTPNWNTPSGYTLRDDSSGAATWELGVFEKITTSSGASGTITLQNTDFSGHQMTGVAFNIYSS